MKKNPSKSSEKPIKSTDGVKLNSELMFSFPDYVQNLKLISKNYWKVLQCKIFIQGIIQKKSVSGSRMLPLVIFDKKVSFFPKIVLLYGICG